MHNDEISNEAERGRGGHLVQKLYNIQRHETITFIVWNCLTILFLWEKCERKMFIIKIKK